LTKSKITFSANFKRDYIAAFAVLIFFCILLSELFLAISIPSYLHQAEAMAFRVRRLNLLSSFDDSRRLFRSIKDKNETAALERRLVAWNLNALADYLREECDNFNSDEVAALQKNVNDMVKILVHLRDRGSYTTEQTLDPSVYLRKLLNAPEQGKP